MVGAFNHFDRHLLSILLESIRVDLELNDLQLGLLSGIVFGGVYAVMGIPIAILASRVNRRNIVLISLASWSLLTLLCGLAQNFWQLALARLGVGIGEAGGTAPSHSMLSDIYPEGQRAGAMAMFAASANLGLFLAMIVGGTVASLLDWRWAFIIAGASGLLLVLLVRVIPEPVREASSGTALSPDRSLLRATAVHLWRDPVLRQVIFGATLNTIVVYGALAWIPAYLIRVHEMSLQMVGLALAVIFGLIGACGTMFGGHLADRLARRDRRWYGWAVAGAILVGKPFMVVFLLSDQVALVIPVLVLATVMGAVFLGPTISLLHDRTAPRMRPVASAVLLFIINLVGLGVGPLLVGFLSEAVFTSQDGLRYALLSVQILGIWAAIHYCLGARALGSGAVGSARPAA